MLIVVLEMKKNSHFDLCQRRKNIPRWRRDTIVTAAMMLNCLSACDRHVMRRRVSGNCWRAKLNLLWLSCRKVWSLMHSEYSIFRNHLTRYLLSRLMDSIRSICSRYRILRCYLRVIDASRLNTKWSALSVSLLQCPLWDRSFVVDKAFNYADFRVHFLLHRHLYVSSLIMREKWSFGIRWPQPSLSS